MNRTLATLFLFASVGLASCTDSTAAPHPSAGDDQQQQLTPPSLAIRPTPSRVAEGIPATAPVIAKTTDEDDAPSEDDHYREQVVGIWKQFESGVRWLKVRENGTATMFIDPAGDWVAKAVIGDGLTMQIEWTINDGRVLMKSISGEPSTAFKAVSTLYGTDRDRAIARLDDEKFVLLDDSDGSKSEWTRVGMSESLPKAIVEGRQSLYCGSVTNPQVSTRSGSRFVTASSARVPHGREKRTRHRASLLAATCGENRSAA
jgi:hypothetical protein